MSSLAPNPDPVDEITALLARCTISESMADIHPSPNVVIYEHSTGFTVQVRTETGTVREITVPSPPEQK